MKTIDQSTWKRKEHFEFFSTFDDPFFGIVSHVDCQFAYEYAKKIEVSFFSWYLYQSVRAVNQIPELRTRVLDNKVVEYSEIHASATIGRDDGTFGFSYIPYHADFNIFNEYLSKEIDRIKNCKGLAFTKAEEKPNVTHYSSIPWINFSGITHARNFKFIDSIPKISFGKATFEQNKMTMPVSLNAHHGLVDGLHAGQYFEAFQQFLNEK